MIATPNQTMSFRFCSRKTLLCCLAVFAISRPIWAQNGSGVVVPAYNDKYSSLVKKLEAGQTNISYREFRESLLESEQFKVVDINNSELRALRKQMHELMKQKKYGEIIEVAKKMLSIDYTDIEAHKILQQTYKVLGDETNRNKYHDIEFGLLKSIVQNGDGKTCQTAWPVVQITEDYFVLQMIDAKLLKQSIDNIGGLCDKMEVQTPEGNKTFYFDVTKVFEGYKKLGIK
jgi:predicted DNA-binding protein (UPF0251 family)